MDFVIKEEVRQNATACITRNHFPQAAACFMFRIVSADFNTMTDDFINDFTGQEELPTMRGLTSGDKVLQKFILQKCLGRGGMGEVWLARDELLGENLALKLLPPIVRADDQAIEDLKNETRSGRQLSHPNIVRVFDFHQDDKNAAIAMEYVDGDPLSRVRSRQPNGVFNTNEITNWTINFVSALDYAHRNHVVHRDLKPSNLLVDKKDGGLKIVDFGIARSIADSMQRCTRSVQATGTLAYMSPEQAMGRSANAADDIYSLGATLYELLAGTPPFFTGEIFHQLQKVPPQPINERRREKGINEPISAVWEAVIMRCLAKERSQRPQSGQEVLDLLGISGGGGNYVAPITTAPAYAEPGHPTVGGVPGHAGSLTEMPTNRPQSNGPTVGPFDHRSTGHGQLRDTGNVAAAASATVSTIAPIISVTAGGHTGKTTIGHQTFPQQPQPQTKSGGKGLFIVLGLALLAGGGVGGLAWWRNQQGYSAIPTSVADLLHPARTRILNGSGSGNGSGNNSDTGSGNSGSGNSGSVASNGSTTGGTTSGSTGSTTGGTTDPGGTTVTPPPPPPPPPAVKWEVPEGFKTVQEAITAAKGPQTIKIAAGVHEGPITLKSGITLMAAGSEPVFIEHDGRSSAIVTGTNVTDVKLIGLTFRPTRNERLTTGQPIGLFEGSSIEAQNCTFVGAGDTGITLRGGEKSSFTDCTFETCTRAGANVLAKAKVTFQTCHFTTNREFGLILENVSTSATIKDTEFLDNGKSGFEVTSGASASIKGGKSNGNGHAGFLVSGAGTSVTMEEMVFDKNLHLGGQIYRSGSVEITGAKISGSDQAGLHLNSCGKVIVTGSTISNNPGSGIIVQAENGACEVVQISEGAIAANAGVGALVMGAGASASITGVDFGPNGESDIVFTEKASGVAKGNKLRTAKDPIVINLEATATQEGNELLPAATGAAAPSSPQ